MFRSLKQRDIHHILWFHLCWAMPSLWYGCPFSWHYEGSSFELKINVNLSLGLDGSNVKLLFQNKLWDEFSIIEVGTCPVHIVNSAFGEAIKLLKESIVDLNETVDFHFISTPLATENSPLLAINSLSGSRDFEKGKLCM